MRLRALRLALALLLAFGTACTGKKAEESVPASPLYTGQEPKRDVLLFLPAKDKPGFAQVKRQVYATASVVAQGKQLLRLLMDGPLADGTETGLAALFAPGAAYAELYLDGRGLAVLDLPTATVQALPGGSSAEVAMLYCLLRTLSSNLPAVTRLQVLIDGQEAESLSGHVDLREPLSLADF